MRLKDHQDAFGHLIHDGFRGEKSYEIAEREDGWVATSGGARTYLSQYRTWSPHQRAAMKYVRGRVLDVGCGAGRVGLHLQGKGFDVLGIDNSPLAIKTCKLRGLKKARVLSITEVDSRLGRFDTIVMMGNNFGLLANCKRAKWLLRRFHGLTRDGGRIVAESNDPYQTHVAEHLAYHKRNRRRGRMSGQLRIRIRYRGYATPWFDYLLVSQDEMRDIVSGTGWRVGRVLESGGSVYIAVIEKE